MTTVTFNHSRTLLDYTQQLQNAVDNYDQIYIATPITVRGDILLPARSFKIECVDRGCINLKGASIYPRETDSQYPITLTNWRLYGGSFTKHALDLKGIRGVTLRDFRYDQTGFSDGTANTPPWDRSTYTHGASDPANIYPIRFGTGSYYGKGEMFLQVYRRGVYFSPGANDNKYDIRVKTYDPGGIGLYQKAIDDGVEAIGTNGNVFNYSCEGGSGIGMVFEAKDDAATQKICEALVGSMRIERGAPAGGDPANEGVRIIGKCYNVFINPIIDVGAGTKFVQPASGNNYLTVLGTQGVHTPYQPYPNALL